jgi:tRNA threonylcarbamoyladenosine biosynthesis protein TsaE
MEKRLIACLDEIEEVAKEILKIISDFESKSSIVLLNGDLASGKTTLTKEIVRLKGYDKEVTSPTFSLEHIYGDGDNIFHYDLYRVGFDDLVNLGLIDGFERYGIHIVEWADTKLKSFLLEAEFKIVEVNISPKDDCREYLIFNCKKLCIN